MTTTLSLTPCVKVSLRLLRSSIAFWRRRTHPCQCFLIATCRSAPELPRSTRHFGINTFRGEPHVPTEQLWLGCLSSSTSHRTVTSVKVGIRVPVLANSRMYRPPNHRLRPRERPFPCTPPPPWRGSEPSRRCKFVQGRGACCLWLGFLRTLLVLGRAQEADNL